MLAPVKGTLFNLVRDCSKSTENVNVVIPDHLRWVVTMWHFDADALTDILERRIFECGEDISLSIAKNGNMASAE